MGLSAFNRMRRQRAQEEAEKLRKQKEEQTLVLNDNGEPYLPELDEDDPEESWTKKQFQDALEQMGVEYSSKATKDQLHELYLQEAAKQLEE